VFVLKSVFFASKKGFFCFSHKKKKGGGCFFFCGLVGGGGGGGGEYSLSILSAVAQLNLLNMTVTHWTTVTYRSDFVQTMWVYLRSASALGISTTERKHVTGFFKTSRELNPTAYNGDRTSSCAIQSVLHGRKAKLQHILRGSTIYKRNNNNNNNNNNKAPSDILLKQTGHVVSSCCSSKSRW